MPSTPTQPLSPPKLPPLTLRALFASARSRRMVDVDHGPQRRRGHPEASTRSKGGAVSGPAPRSLHMMPTNTTGQGFIVPIVVPPALFGAEPAISLAMAQVEDEAGRQFYQCFCGDAGLISGSIKTFEAKQSSARSKPDSMRTKMQETEEVSGSPGTIALPPSRKGGSIVQ